MIQCHAEDAPVVPASVIVDVTRFCTIVNPELSFMCTPEPPQPSQPHEDQFPVNGQQPLPFLMGSISLVILLLFLSGFICYVFRFYSTLARILNFLRFTPVSEVAVDDHTHGLHKEPSSSDILFDAIIASGQYPSVLGSGNVTQC